MDVPSKITFFHVLCASSSIEFKCGGILRIPYNHQKPMLHTYKLTCHSVEIKPLGLQNSVMNAKKPSVVKRAYNESPIATTPILFWKNVSKRAFHLGNVGSGAIIHPGNPLNNALMLLIKTLIGRHCTLKTRNVTQSFV